MTVAPPRISITPTASTSTGSTSNGAPPVPASADPAGSPIRRSTSPTGAPQSLIDSTAHLFSSVPEGVVRRLVDEGGTRMSGHQHESGSGGITPFSGGAPSGSGTVVRRFLDPKELSSGPAPTDVTGSRNEAGDTLRPGQLDALVDAVVERVEQRVIDELERRGRRQSWAAF